MDKLVIAPTAEYTRGPLRKEINDEIKDSPDAIRVQQRVDSIISKNADKSKGEPVEQVVYKDNRPMRHLHQRNRERDLNIYDLDELYSQRPMYNISLPTMKLRKQT